LRAIEKSTSFLKKRSKRLLSPGISHDRGGGPDRSAGEGIKVFWFFSSEKNSLPASPISN
jgi:hypothetical protein